MAARWSSEHVVADHREIQANTMAIDKTGQHAVLAGRRYVAIVHLDHPATPIKKAHRHNSKWDVASAEWSPYQAELFALACNQRAELLLWTSGDVAQHNVLRAHTRAISDLNWSTFDSNVLATASIDTYIHLWDIRDPRKPSMSLSAVAGAFQVKWNKISPNMLATSHEGDIRLWDSRKGTSPVQYITAHLSKIHSMEWCPTQENLLATSSQDCTVKFWDVTSPQKKDSMLSLGCPVWRAQYTPFGYGLVTVVVPPLRRGENSLLLWNMADHTNPVHTFMGHSDVVMEFGWRKPSEDSKDFQLVTWSRDHSLRIWTVDQQLQKSCGQDDLDDDEGLEILLNHQLGLDSQDITDNTSQASQTSPRETEAGGLSTPPTSPPRTRNKIEDSQPTPTTPTPTTPTAQPQNLQQEFSLVNMNIPNITVKEMDVSKRCCTVIASSGINEVCVKLSFPSSYPYNASPTFQFCKGTNVDEEIKEKLLKVLQMVSQQQVRRNRSCLEPCLRQLVGTLESLTAQGDEKGLQITESPFLMGPVKQTYIPTYISSLYVPFPRTSGARFCGADMLVVFTRPPHLQRINAPTDTTPRSLSALAAYLTSHVLPMKGRASSSPAQYPQVYPPVAQSPVGEAAVSISSFYQQDRKSMKTRRNTHARKLSYSKTSNCGSVLIYSVSKLMPINYFLAQNYVFNFQDMATTCTKNATLAAVAGCEDLVQVWSLVNLISSPLLVPSPDPDHSVPWSQHPFGRTMVQSLIFHYINKHDVQTAAMLTCAFSTKLADASKSKKSVDLGSESSGSPGGSPYHTVVPADNTHDSWNLVVATLKRNRSNSWSDSVEEYRFVDPSSDPKDSEKEIHEANIRLLDPKLVTQYDQFKTAYANILYRWNLLEQRAQVLKHVSVIPPKHKGVEFVAECQHCHKDVRGPQCISCKRHSFSCVICRIAVKGCSSFCLSCGHGGHTTHMEEWFSDMEVCPSGCGCRCLEESNIFGS